MKRGDTIPALRTTLLDKNGVAVNLTDATVQVTMRSLENGDVILSRDGEVSDPTTGVVVLDWEAGDTDTTGDYLLEWQVTDGTGDVQTYPTVGYHVLHIAPDLDDDSIPVEDLAKVLRVRGFANEPTASAYSDAAILLMLGEEGSVEATVARIWREKAGRWAHLVDVSESGSSRKFSDLSKNAAAMAKMYGDMTIITASTVNRPRSRPIVRP